MKDRILALRKELYKHDRLYYSGKPEIPDHQYDRMFQKLIQLEQQYPEYYDDNSPTKRVGSELVNQFTKHKHPTPVLSVRNVSEEQLAQLLNEHGQLIAQTKLDGICVNLLYENGTLSKAISRGNGFVGNILTDNVRTITNVPYFLPEKITVEIRGEIVLPLNEYRKFKDTYKNPQAAAASIIRFQKSSDAAAHNLLFVAHGATLSWEVDQDESIGVYKQLSKWNFTIPETKLLTKVSDIDDALKLYNINPQLPADGVVFKVSDARAKKKLGHNRRYYNWAWSWKPQAMNSGTILGIYWNTSAKGNITPVALFETPFVVDGNVIAKTSLHNLYKLVQLQIIPGSVVEVAFKGKVPNIIRTIENAGKPVIPVCCPQCGTPVTKFGQSIRCENQNGCPAQSGECIPPKHFTYAYAERFTPPWGYEHATVVAQQLGMFACRAKKGSPYFNIYYNSVNQLASFFYTMAAQSIVPEQYRTR